MTRWKNMVQVRDVSLYLIPRCASTAMRGALLRGIGEDPDYTATRNPALNRGCPEQASQYRVAFLRDPAERAVSVWKGLLCQWMSDGDSTRHLIDIGFQFGCTLDRFVNDLVLLRHLDIHTMNQHELIGDTDFLGRFESLNEDWGRLRRIRPWLPALRTRNSTWPVTLSDGMRARIRRLYPIDHRLWLS